MTTSADSPANAPTDPPSSSSSSQPPPTAGETSAATAGASGGGDQAAYWRAEFEKVRQQRDERTAKLREYEAQADKDLASEFEAMKQQLAEKTEAEAQALEQLKERDRADVRRQFVDSILTRVPEGNRKAVGLMIAGLEQSGEVVIPDENPVEAGEALATKLADSYPAFFSGGSSGPGNPAGPGTGPLPGSFMDLTPEQQRNLSDEDFAKHYGSGRTRKKRRTLMDPRS